MSSASWDPWGDRKPKGLAQPGAAESVAPAPSPAVDGVCPVGHLLLPPLQHQSCPRGAFSISVTRREVWKVFCLLILLKKKINKKWRGKGGPAEAPRRELGRSESWCMKKM